MQTGARQPRLRLAPKQIFHSVSKTPKRSKRRTERKLCARSIL
jgi:hypothetical protein